MELELYKIYNVILENVTNVYETPRLLTGTGARIDPNR